MCINLKQLDATLFFSCSELYSKTVSNQTCICSCSVFKRMYLCQQVFCQRGDKKKLCVFGKHVLDRLSQPVPVVSVLLNALVGSKLMQTFAFDRKTINISNQISMLQ